jgi:predicted nucleic acid-binding protein
LKILVDTDVVLDLLLDRRSFSASAAAVFALVEGSRVEAALCATTVTTIDYLLKQSVSPRQARRALKGLLDLFDIAPVNRPVLEQAFHSDISDFEDAVLAHSAALIGADFIITRNMKDFRGSPIPAIDPNEFIAMADVR